MCYKIKMNNSGSMLRKTLPPIIYYLHIHKGGGSSFIDLARKVGRAFFRPHKNGNPVFPFPDQKFSYNDRRIPFWRWAADLQRDFLLSCGADFICNERCLGDAVPWDERITMITTLRDPLDLALSNYKQRSRRGFFRQNEKFADCLRYGKYTWLDNCLIRHFVPEGKEMITDADLKLAKKRLEMFDLILFLDDYPRLPGVLSSRFGWSLQASDLRHVLHGSGRVSRAKDELADDPDTLDYLQNRLAYDIAFYHYAKELAAKMAQGGRPAGTFPFSPVKKAQKNCPPEFNAAMVFAALNRGDMEDAAVYMQQATTGISLPIDIMARYAYYKRCGNEEEQRNCLDHSVISGSDDPGVHLWRGKEYEQRHYYERALEIYSKGCDHVKDHIEIRLALIGVLLRLRKYRAAKDVANDMLVLAPPGSLDHLYICGELIKISLVYRCFLFLLKYGVYTIKNILMFPLVRRRMIQKLFS